LIVHRQQDRRRHGASSPSGRGRLPTVRKMIRMPEPAAEQQQAPRGTKLTTLSPSRTLQYPLHAAQADAVPLDQLQVRHTRTAIFEQIVGRSAYPVDQPIAIAVPLEKGRVGDCQS
jgi:hypothetical protein